MSDTPHTHDDHDAPHEGPIRTPKQLILTVVFAFLVPIVGIILLVNFVAADKKAGAGSDALSEEATLRRIQPVGMVELKDVSSPGSLKSGEEVFKAQCAACHATGAAGAPKLGDAAAWAPRLGQGYEALLNAALKGKGAMGPQGGGDFSDLEIGRAVVYMANQAGGKFAEPKAPANGQAAAGTQAAPADSAAAQQAAAAVTAANQAAAAPAAAGGEAKAGGVPALYQQACAACHTAGVAGAPKLGDKAAWGPRLALGVDGLTTSAVKGKGAMPPKGGAAAASDADIRAVVEYMVSTVK